MRWVFAVLVLVNLGFWLWASGIRERTDEPPPGPRPALAADKMRLLSEPGVKLVPRPKARSEPPPAPPVAEPTAPASEDRAPVGVACYRIGPFASTDAADKAGAALAELHLEFVRETQELRRVASHRVYLPPLPSKEAAEARRRDLTQKGFRDHALIQEEGMQHAISLGVFSVEANARRHMKTLAAKGIETSIEPLYQIRTAHWLALRIDPAARPGEDVVATLRQRRWDAAEVRLTDAPCPRTGEIAAKPEAAGAR